MSLQSVRPAKCIQNSICNLENRNRDLPQQVTRSTASVQSFSFFVSPPEDEELLHNRNTRTKERMCFVIARPNSNLLSKSTLPCCYLSSTRLAPNNIHGIKIMWYFLPSSSCDVVPCLACQRGTFSK